MEIYNNLYNTISNLKNLREQKELPKQTIDYFLSNVPYPIELTRILFEHSVLSLKILSKYMKFTLEYIEKKLPL
jgi:hypothetical protein